MDLMYCLLVCVLVLNIVRLCQCRPTVIAYGNRLSCLLRYCNRMNMHCGIAMQYPVACVLVMRRQRDDYELRRFERALNGASTDNMFTSSLSVGLHDMRTGWNMSHNDQSYHHCVLARDSIIIMHSALYAIARPSVCPSVCYTGDQSKRLKLG